MVLVELGGGGVTLSNDFPPSCGEQNGADQAEERSLFHWPIFLERTPWLIGLCMP